MSPELSVVIPIRNESPNIEALYVEMTEALERWGRSYEVLAIDDGSTDDSFERLAAVSAARSPLAHHPLPQKLRTDRRVFRRLPARARASHCDRGRRPPERSSRFARHDPPHRRRQRHRLRMAQGSQRPVADAPAAVGARQQADLVVDRRQAARLRLLAEGLSRRCREAAEALRRDAPFSSGDCQRDGRHDRRGRRQPSREKARRVEVRLVENLPRHPRSADGQVPAELLDAPAADVRAHRRADGISGFRDCRVSLVRTAVRLRVDRQSSAAAARRAADFLRHPARHDGAARRNHVAHVPRVAGQAHLRDSGSPRVPAAGTSSRIH